MSAEHGTAGLERFELYRNAEGDWSLTAWYAPADDSGRHWHAVYGPFATSRDAEDYARNMPLPGDPELGPVRRIGTAMPPMYAIYPEAVPHA